MKKLLILFLTTVSNCWELTETTIDAYVNEPTTFTIELGEDLKGQCK